MSTQNGLVERMALMAMGASLYCASSMSVAAVSDADSAALQEITVTGIRKSVQLAQDIKREAPSVVEAITTEDLGKFTDTNIADALQRVPGINITRTAGTFDAGYGVVIRGLDGSYSSSTLNGRELLGITDFFGGGGRNFDFQTVPPEILSGVQIFKTSTASQVEPGLSGQVDLETLRPLDYKGKMYKNLFGSFSVGAGSEIGNLKAWEDRKYSPRLAATLGGKFLDGTLGVFIAGVFSDDWAYRDFLEHYDGRFDFTLDNGKQYKNTLVNEFGYDIWRAHEKRTKRSFAGGLQWKPNSNIEVNGDFEYNKSAIVRRDQANYWYPAIGGGKFGAQPIPADALKFCGSGPGVCAWDATKIPGLGAYTYNYLGALHIDYTDETKNGGMNAVWKNDSDTIKVTGDYSHSDLNYFIRWLHPYIDNALTSTYLETVDASGYRPIINITQSGGGPSVSDYRGYTEQQFSEFFETQDTSDRNAFRLDFDFKFSDALNLRVGARRVDTTTKLIDMALPPSLTGNSVANAFTGRLIQLPFTNFVTPELNFDGICASNPQLCNAENAGKGSFIGGFPTNPHGKAGDTLSLQTGNSYQVKETNTAVYTQLDFQQPVFGIPMTGNVGLRAVHITEDAMAFQGKCEKIGFESNPCVSNDNFVLVDAKNAYWKYLPSLNTSFKPWDNTALRFSAAKVMHLPNYFDLAPVGKVSIVLPTTSGVRLGNNIANIHNPNLKPTEAINYDITGEYYTDYGGAYIASVFYKDVKNLIVSTTQQNVTVPGYGTALFDTTTTGNVATGHTEGFELGTNQPFTFLPSPWDGLGAQLNYTFVDTKTNIYKRDTAFPGSSKNNVNSSVYYERDGYSARVAVSYRGSYLSAAGSSDRIGRAETRVEASISKQFAKHWEVILTGTNLTGQDTSIYDAESGLITSYYQQPRTYSISLRGNL